MAMAFAMAGADADLLEEADKAAEAPAEESEDEEKTSEE
jgi:hypothetical protein